MKYEIVGFRMDPKTIPSFVPAGDYRIEIKVNRLVGNEQKQLYVFDCDTRVDRIE